MQSFQQFIFQNDWTALMMASMSGKADVVELLLKHNADMNVRKKVKYKSIIIVIN